MKSNISASLSILNCPLLIIFLITLAFTTKAQEWSEPIPIFEGGRNYRQDFAIDSNGNLHVVLEHVITPYQFAKIYYSKSTDQGETWTTPYSIAQNNSGWLSSPKIAIDANNTIYVTYDNIVTEYDTWVNMQVFSDNTWGLPIVVSDNLKPSYYSRLALDNNGVLYIFWFYYGEITLQYRTYYQGEFSTISQLFNNSSINNVENAIFDRENKLHCLGFTAPPFASYPRLVYHTFVNQQWSNVSVIGDSTTSYANMNITPNGFPRVVNQLPDINPFRTQYSSYQDETWSTQIIAGESEQHALFVEKNGTEHIVQSEKTATGYDHVYYTLNYDGWNRNIIATMSFLTGPNKLIAFDTTLYLTYCHPFTNNVNDYAVYIRKRTIEAQSAIYEKDIFIGFEVFPNPAHTELSIRFLDTANSPIEVRILDINGKNVLKLMCSENQLNTIINIEHLSTGLYYVVVKSKNTSTTKTIVITK